MRPLDPLLLGSFPAPPTHIPLTPTSPNPPPSRPPSSPLPPLPTRTPSPDIPTIISATPRVKQRTSQCLYRPASDDDDTRSWIDHDDFGRPLHIADLEGFDSDDSDSSLGLHTPLPSVSLCCSSIHILTFIQSSDDAPRPAVSSVETHYATPRP